jgi:hypothetical protein
MNAMDHVRHLAEKIGPRGSTTAEEKEAADYVYKHLADFGLQPVMEAFRGARSAWLPAALFWSIVLASGFLFLGGSQTGAIFALVLTVTSLGSILLELMFRPNFLRWTLPKGESQNVWARIEAKTEANEHVALVAHLDSHRTPLVFSSDRWVRWFERLVPIGMAFAALLIAILTLGIVLPFPWLRIMAIGPMMVALGMLVVLDLAEQLARDPLEHTTVWIILTGCEEVGCYGAEDFIRRHKSELRHAAWITVDTVGSRNGVPVTLSQETFLSTTKSDGQLLEIARSISSRRPELRTREISMKGAYTEGAIGAKHGLRVLTIESHQEDGTLSEWRRPTDRVENVSPECVQATETLVYELLLELDAKAASV